MAEKAEYSLVADIGGTNARFALADEKLGLCEIRQYACADFAGPDLAVKEYIKDSGAVNIRRGCFAVACPADADSIHFTNSHWRFSLRDIAQRLGLQHLSAINDFTALAYAVNGLKADERVQIGGGAALPGFAKAVIGPGTGLGVSGLLPCGDRWVAVSGEGGHVGFAPSNAQEDAILQNLRKKYGRVSAERLLCGQGLADLHQALLEIDGDPSPQPFSAMEVSRLAETSGDTPEGQNARRTISVFFRILGTVAGDLALTLGAKGGVYIGGGIVPRFATQFAASDFRRQFEAKGRFQSYLEKIPVWLITAATPALRGAAYAAWRL